MKNRQDRREEVNGITTALFLTIVTLCIIGAIIQTIFNVL